MLRSQALFAAIMLCLGCAHQAVAETNDATQIYGKFIDRWTGKEKNPINVSITAKAPSAEDLKEFSNCANEKGASTHWAPVKPIDDLSVSLGNLSYVHLVDPDKWSARDPHDLMAQGQAVESAVEGGFAEGLFTFSAIAFDEAHSTAAFTYSFVCGALCGNGGTVIFKKTQNGWSQSDNQCASWMSYVQRGRPNNSFKPKPLRGSA
jgi:hypothetical protein